MVIEIKENYASNDNTILNFRRQIEMERFRKRRSDGYEAAVASNSSKWKGNLFSKVIFLSFKFFFF